MASSCAPGADIGRWRTAALRIRHRIAFLVRQIGEIPVPNPKIAKHRHPRCRGLGGTLRCSARQFWRAKHRDVPPRCVRGTCGCSANFGLVVKVALRNLVIRHGKSKRQQFAKLTILFTKFVLHFEKFTYLCSRTTKRTSCKRKVSSCRTPATK